AGVRVVKAFNRFGFEVDKFSQTNEEQRQRSTNAMRAMAIFHPAIMLTVNLGVVAILWIGGRWIESGAMQSGQVGALVAFINYMTQILFSLMMVSMVFTMFVRARASALRISEVFSQPDGMAWNADVSIKRPEGRIEFRNVAFAYGEDAATPVLKNISF